MMSLDYGAANRQPDSHSILFRCIESFKEFVRGFRSEADSDIFDGNAHPIPLIPFGSDEQISRAIFDGGHRVRSISYQVEDDLLELNTIARDWREIVRQLRPQNHLTPLEIAQRQGNHLSRGLVQIEGLQREFLLTEQGTQSRDHIRGAVAIANDPPRCFARAGDVWRNNIQHPKTSTGVGDDSRKRLRDLMGDRGSQSVQCRDPRHEGKLGAGSVEGLLGDLVFGYVLKSADEQGATSNLLHDARHSPHVLDGASSGHNPEHKIDVLARHTAR